MGSLSLSKGACRREPVLPHAKPRRMRKERKRITYIFALLAKKPCDPCGSRLLFSPKLRALPVSPVSLSQSRKGGAESAKELPTSSRSLRKNLATLAVPGLQLKNIL
jgi:hypothetical protein